VAIILKSRWSKTSLLFILLFLFFFLSRTISHYNLYTNYHDLFFFDHSLWASVGQSMPDTGHFSPILSVFALFYLIYPSPLWMFAIQSLFVAGIGTLIFAFAKTQLENKEVKLVLFLLLTNVTFRYMGFHDFHQDITITLLLSAALYLLFTKNKVLIPAILMLCGFLAKEVAGIAIASFGLFVFLFRKEKLIGAILFIAGIAGTAYLVGEVMPKISGNYLFSGYYSHFGSNIYEQITNMAFHPLRTLSFLFSPANLLYVILLFGPLALLPLFSPSVLTIGLLPLLENLLSNYRFQKDITVQYSCVLLPVLFFSLILAIKSLKQKGRWETIYRRSKPVIIFFAILSVLAFFILNLRMYIPTKRVFSAHKIMHLIPDQAKVSASKYLIVHLSYRDNIYLFPQINDAEYVIYEDGNFKNQGFVLVTQENGIYLWQRAK